LKFTVGTTSLKFEVDTLRNVKVVVTNILMHQNNNLKSGRRQDTGAGRIALHIPRIVELKSINLKDLKYNF
jgi:hypothetical protein